MIYINKDKIEMLEEYGFAKIKNACNPIKVKYIVFDENVIEGKYKPIFTIIKVSEEDYWGEIHEKNNKILELLFQLIINNIITNIDNKNTFELIKERS